MESRSEVARLIRVLEERACTEFGDDRVYGVRSRCVGDQVARDPSVYVWFEEGGTLGNGDSVMSSHVAASQLRLTWD
eukprot:11641-Rhodomonas_salina.1